MENTTITQYGSRADFMTGVYRWMTSGLLVTALVSFAVLQSTSLLSLLILNQWVFFGLLIAELGLVWYLSARIESLSTETATLLFFLYAAMNGVTLSLIFLVYTATSISTVFLTAAGTFGLMSIYGATTKKDLSGVGGIAIMGLFGLIIASIINLFVGSANADWLISVIGVLVFVALTAYDTQKIQQSHMSPILGALHLYLDFINLFIYMLRLFGTRRD